VAVTSRSVAERFLNEMANDLRVSRRLTLESWRQRGLLNRTREKFWQAFGEVF
jgi:hypothetical protein